jgi:hypothetical protein
LITDRLFEVLAGSCASGGDAAIGNGDGQVVFLLVEVAGSHVYTHVARTAVAGAFEQGVVLCAVIVIVVVAVGLGDAGQGRGGTKHKGFI